jgi:hypothetical protein
VVVVVGATVVVVVVVGRGQLTLSDSLLTEKFFSGPLPAAHDTLLRLPGANGLRVVVAAIAAPIPKNKTEVAAKTAIPVVSWFFTNRPGQEFVQIKPGNLAFSSSSRSLRTSSLTFAADRSIGAPYFV